MFGESGGATDEDIVKAAGYAISLGVRIVNLSLGGRREIIYRSSSIQEAITELEKNYDVLHDLALQEMEELMESVMILTKI